MKVFTTTAFVGFYPIGTAAIAVAASKDQAKTQLESAFSAVGLKQTIKIEEIDEVDLSMPSTRILLDGNY